MNKREPTFGIGKIYQECRSEFLEALLQIIIAKIRLKT